MRGKPADQLPSLTCFFHNRGYWRPMQFLIVAQKANQCCRPKNRPEDDPSSRFRKIYVHLMMKFSHIGCPRISIHANHARCLTVAKFSGIQYISKQHFHRFRIYMLFIGNVTFRPIQPKIFHTDGRQRSRKLVFLEFMIQLNRISISGGTQYIDTYSSNEKIVEIIDYINHNLTKELSIDNISDRFFMSRYYLMHSFKEATGYTIGNYVSTKRLLLARDLIQNGTPVKTACYECGFKSYSAFIRAYKKSFDTLPSASFPY